MVQGLQASLMETTTRVESLELELKLLKEMVLPTST